MPSSPKVINAHIFPSPLLYIPPSRIHTTQWRPNSHGPLPDNSNHPHPRGVSPRGGVGVLGGGAAPPANRVREWGVEGPVVRRDYFSSPRNPVLAYALPVQLSMCMCVMAFNLVLVFRPVSPLSGHIHTAGRRDGALPCLRAWTAPPY